MMSRIGKVVGILAMASAAAMLGLGALVFVQPAAAGNVAQQAAQAVSGAVSAVDAQAGSAVDAHGGPGGRGMFCGTAGLEAAATALGTTADDLQTQLQSGQTLEDLATAAGVDIADVQSAIQTACAQAQRDAIEQAVTDGTLTREKADWLLEGLDKGYWGPGAEGTPGFGPGFGGDHGGPGGPGFGPGREHGPRPDDAAPDDSAPTETAPANTSVNLS
jgi:hypothetical protein